MELIFGGAYQGKTQYAAQKYHLAPSEIFTCDGIILSKDARCICHLERFAKACCEAGLDARAITVVNATGRPTSRGLSAHTHHRVRSFILPRVGLVTFEKSNLVQIALH